MRGLYALAFILLLPALTALGHDIYITYQEQDFTKPMMFSDVGYLWTSYEPDTYEWTKKNVSEETWSNIITPFLEQTSVLVALVPACVVGIILLLLKLLEWPPFAPEVTVKKGHRKSKFGFGSGDRAQGKIKYKRKK